VLTYSPNQKEKRHKWERLTEKEEVYGGKKRELKKEGWTAEKKSCVSKEGRVIMRQKQRSSKTQRKKKKEEIRLQRTMSSNTSRKHFAFDINLVIANCDRYIKRLKGQKIQVAKGKTIPNVHPGRLTEGVTNAVEFSITAPGTHTDLYAGSTGEANQKKSLTTMTKGRDRGRGVTNAPYRKVTRRLRERRPNELLLGRPDLIPKGADQAPSHSREKKGTRP